MGFSGSTRYVCVPPDYQKLADTPRVGPELDVPADVVRRGGPRDDVPLGGVGQDSDSRKLRGERGVVGSYYSREGDGEVTMDRTNLGTKVSDEWQTPEEWVMRFRAALGGSIGLDPCNGNVEGHVYVPIALTTWGPEEDALKQSPVDWQLHGPIYMNPPFSHPKPWANALTQCDEVSWLAIMNTSSSSFAWQTLAKAADLILFPKKRIAFIDPKTGKAATMNRYDQTIFTTARRVDVWNALGDHCLIVSKPGWSR